MTVSRIHQVIQINKEKIKKWDKGISEKIPQRESDVKQVSTTDSDGNQLSAGQQAYFADNKNPTVDDDINNRLAVTSDNSQQEAEGVLKLAQTEEEKALTEKLLLYVQRRKENEARRRKSLTRKTERMQTPTSTTVY